MGKIKKKKHRSEIDKRENFSENTLILLIENEEVRRIRNLPFSCCVYRTHVQREREEDTGRDIAFALDWHGMR